MTIVPDESRLVIRGRSSLHSIEAEAKGLTGIVDIATNGSTLVLDPPPSMRIEVPVDRIRSGNEMQDAETRRLVGAKRFPNIVATLEGLEPLPESNRYGGRGTVTINGTTKACTGTMTIGINDGVVVIDGEVSADIRNWGIVPPRILFLTVEPEFKIQLHAVARSATGVGAAM